MTLTNEETRLTYACIMCASYARYLHLRHSQMILGTEEERDLKRLHIWWANLGETQKDKLLDWVKAFSHDTEDVTGRSGRKEMRKWSQSQ